MAVWQPIEGAASIGSHRCPVALQDTLPRLFPGSGVGWSARLVCKELQAAGDPSRGGCEPACWLCPVVYLGRVSAPVLGNSCAAGPHKVFPRVKGKEADGASSCASHDA